MNRIIPSRAELQLVIRYTIALLIVAFFVFNGLAIVYGLIPFALAFLFSLALDPLVTFLATRLRLGRAWSSLLVLLLIITLGGLLLTWIATSIASQVAVFIDAFPGYRDTVLSFIDNAAHWLTQVFHKLPPEVAEFITENASRLSQAAEQLLVNVGTSLLFVLRGLPSVITLLTFTLVVPVAMFFMCKDLPAIKRLLWTVVPDKAKPVVSTVFRDLLRVAWRYLRAQCILVLITMAVTMIGLLIIGVDNWFVAGLLIGLLDFLPVIGPIVVYAPWAGYLFIAGDGRLALSLLVVYAVAAGGRALAEAKVVGDSVGLHPLATLMAIFIGALLWGVGGAVAGPIVVTVAKAVYKAWRNVTPPSSR